MDLVENNNNYAKNTKKITENEHINMEKNEKFEESEKITDSTNILVIRILNICGFAVTSLDQLDNLSITRDLLISLEKYNNVIEYLDGLRKLPGFSSSTLTSLHKDALSKQKWPLLNLVRQVLRVNYFIMKPYRKSDGKHKSGKKKYTRFFLIEKLKKITEL